MMSGMGHPNTQVGGQVYRLAWPDVSQLARPDRNLSAISPTMIEPEHGCEGSTFMSSVPGHSKYAVAMLRCSSRMYGSFARPSRGEMERLREMRAKKFTTCRTLPVRTFAMEPCNDGGEEDQQVQFLITLKQAAR